MHLGGRPVDKPCGTCGIFGPVLTHPHCDPLLTQNSMGILSSKYFPNSLRAEGDIQCIYHINVGQDKYSTYISESVIYAT